MLNNEKKKQSKTKGYKNNEIFWLFVSLRLRQVQAFP